MAKTYNRRKFLKRMGIAGIGAVGLSRGVDLSVVESFASTGEGGISPAVISTWKHGLAANQAAWAALQNGHSALDAVEKGVNVSENDPDVMSVGLGGLPDREGFVTLDACIMDRNGNAGAVGFLQGYKNAVSVARKVMEETEHVMLVGEGAETFAAAKGFKKEKLLTEKAEGKWRRWLDEREKKPNKSEIHDTIGMIALDTEGNLAGACTTSGLRYKMHGRVGDSPIIGAGLYVDNKVGGAAATGVGEECIKVCGSFLVVEMMRNGASPEEACMEAVKRIARRHDIKPDFQVAFIALNRKGEFGAYALTENFSFALMKEGDNRLLPAEFFIK